MPKSAPLYLYTGPEVAEKQVAIEKLIADITKTHGAPDLIKLYPQDSNIDDWYGELQNGSLFSTYRVFHFQRIDEFPAGDIKTIVQGIENLPEDTTLLFTTLHTQAPAGIDKKVPASQKKVFWELFENQKHRWIDQYVSKQGKVIGQDGIDAILSLVENNTRDLRETCDRLLAFTQEESEITEAHVDTFIYHSKEENVFTLFAAIARRDLEGSLRILQTLALSGDATPSALLPGLLWQLRRLLSLATLYKNGLSLNDAFIKASVLGKGSPIRGKRNQEIYRKAVENYSVRELEAIIARVADSEELARSLKSDQSELIMELFLYIMIAKRGAPLSSYKGFTPRPIH